MAIQTGTAMDLNLSKFGAILNQSTRLADSVTAGVAEQGGLVGLAIGLAIALGLLIGLIFLVITVIPRLIGKIKGIKGGA